MSVIYHPPLYVQTGEYSAADMRRYTEGLYLDGVNSPGHLKVSPRAEGASLSVDVARGEVVVFGQQAQEGRYVCSLDHKVNIAVASGPASGSQRYDLIAAEVQEESGEWEVVRIAGQAGPNAAWDSWSAAAAGRTLYKLAVVGPIASTTGQITAPMILDCRWIGRPAPLGGFVTLRTRLGEHRVSGPSAGETEAVGMPNGLIQVPVLPWDTDVHVTLSVVLRSSDFNSVVATTGLARLQSGTFTWTKDWSPDWSSHFMDFRSISRQMFHVIPAFTGPWFFEAIAGKLQGTPDILYHNGEMVVRMSPRGGLVS